MTRRAADRPGRPFSRRRPLAPHETGLAVTVAGFVVMSPDGLLIRLVESSPWTLAFWRCLLVGATLGTFVVLRARRETAKQFRAIGAAGLVVAGFSAAGNLAFVLSMAYTDVANTLLIVCAAPLFAAGLSRWALRERVARHTWAAIAVVLAGTGIIVAGSGGGSSLVGSLLAVASAVATAAIATAIRRSREVSMIPAVVLGYVLAVAAAAPFVSAWIPAQGDWALLAIMGLVVLPVGVGLVTLGPRYLPAPEVNLLSLVETVLGPLWVWWAVAERPTVQALAAAGVIVPTLLVHSVLAARAARASRGQPTRPAPPRT